MVDIDISEPVILDCVGGSIEFEPSGKVALVAADGPRLSQTPTDLTSSNLVAIWFGGVWALFIGLKAQCLWFARPAQGQLIPVGKLDRLDLSAGDDSGGLHRVEFHPLRDSDVLVTWERGVARVSAGGQLMWQQAHDQLPARVVAWTDDVVWLKGERERFGIRLSDGLQVPH